MGDIKRIRKKYTTPMHPWNRERIDAEKIYKRTYGLVNKKEVWKAESLLKGFKDQIKKFPSMEPQQAEKQRQQLRSRLKKLGFVDDNTNLGDVLGFDTELILSRRLQTIVHKKGLARSVKQARQFITHEHILVDGKVINAPGYIVSAKEESTIVFKPTSVMANEAHPERKQPENAQPKPKKSGKNQQEEVPEIVALVEEDEDLE